MELNVFFQSEVDREKLFAGVDLSSDKLDQYIVQVFKLISKDYEPLASDVNIILCDNSYITKLNRDYRNKNIATDVLSFVSDDVDIDNEIYISVEFILGIERFKADSFFWEFIFILIHGFLHIYGYDHISSEEKMEMNKEEDKYFYLSKEVVK